MTEERFLLDKLPEHIRHCYCLESIAAFLEFFGPTNSSYKIAFLILEIK